jgi:hypothetical protein
MLKELKPYFQPADHADASTISVHLRCHVHPLIVPFGKLARAIPAIPNGSGASVKQKPRQQWSINFVAATRPENPERKRHEEARLKIVDARKVRTAEREAARILREKALAEQTAREAERLAEEQRAAAELAQRLAREKAEEQAKIAAEQKVARDARYAARKAAKKQRGQQQKERQPLR